MDLPNLYRLFANCADVDGNVTNFPTWDRIAESAKVDPLDDAKAVRALIEKGAMQRIPVGAGLWRDYNYRIVRPRPDGVACFEHALMTIGASCAPYSE